MLNTSYGKDGTGQEHQYGFLENVNGRASFSMGITDFYIVSFVSPPSLSANVLVMVSRP